MPVSQTQQVACSSSSSSSLRKVDKQDHSKYYQADEKQYDPDFRMKSQPRDRKGKEKERNADDKSTQQYGKEQDPADKPSNERNVPNQSRYRREEKANACHQEQIASYSQTSGEAFWFHDSLIEKFPLTEVFLLHQMDRFNRF